MIITYSFPNDSRPLVKEEDKIDFNTPLLDKKISKEVEILVARELGINPKNIFRYLSKLVGETIKKNEIVASKKSFFSTKKVKSAVDGIIKEINHHEGLLIIESVDQKSTQTLSPFKGKVEKVSKNHIDISLTKGQEFPLKKAKFDFGGEVFYLDHNTSLNLSSSDIENKIVFSENISSFLQTKTEALGAKGYITLQEPPQQTEIYTVLLKNIDDIKKINKEKFSYCSIVSKTAKIYFYS